MSREAWDISQTVDAMQASTLGSLLHDTPVMTGNGNESKTYPYDIIERHSESVAIAKAWIGVLYSDAYTKEQHMLIRAESDKPGKSRKTSRETRP